MKKYNIFFILLAITLLMSSIIACNVAKDNVEEQTDAFVVDEDKTSHRATVAEFKQMSSQEQWKLLTPAPQTKNSKTPSSPNAERTHEMKPLV